MTEEWLWLWFSFFKLNEDYKSYCEAQRNGDNDVSEELEQRYPKIAELYEDWGDIHNFDPRNGTNKSIEYQTWLEERRTLFFSAELDEPEILTGDPDHSDCRYLYIKVPLLPKVTPVIRQVSNLLRSMYKEEWTAIRLKELQAKYTLAVKKPGDDQVLLGIRKALNVWEYAQPVNGITPTALKVVKNVEQRIRAEWQNTLANNWQWCQDGREEAGNEAELIRQVRRYKKEASNIIKNTIYGRFPVKS